MRNNLRRIVLLVMLLATITIFGTRDVTGLLAEAGFESGLLRGKEAELAALQYKLDNITRLREILIKRAESPGLMARFLDFDGTDQVARFDIEIVRLEHKIEKLRQE